LDLDTTIFIVSPLALSATMAWTYNQHRLGFVLLTLGSVASLLWLSYVVPDIVMLWSPIVGAVHGVQTWSFPYAAAATAGTVAIVRRAGFSLRLATVVGAIVCLGTTSAGCWIA